MRSLVLAVLLIGTLLAASVRAQDSAEWDRSFSGVLPQPDDAVSINPKERMVTSPRRRAAYILDAETLRPVSGAVMWCYAERSHPHVVSYGERVAEARADSNGLVVLDPGAAAGTFHWVAEAPGYAPSHLSPTDSPEPLTLLRRGPDAFVRVRDGLGRPVNGASVDLYPGCLHGPSVVTGRTSVSGHFNLGLLVPRKWWFDVRTHTGASDQVGTEGTLGRRPWDVILEPRLHVRGRVVDDHGRPVAGAAVHSSAWWRAPRTVTEEDGSFDLPGCSARRPLQIVLSGGAEPVALVRRFGATPVTVRIGSGDSAHDTPGAISNMTIRTAPLQRIRLTRDDGLTIHTTANGDDEDAPGVAAVDLPLGRYVVEPATRFGPVAFRPRRLQVATDDGTWDIADAAPQPRLVVRGSIPRDAKIVLAVEDEAIEKPQALRPSEWHPYLPVEDSAAVRVRQAGHWRVWHFFPVGPIKNGVRAVDVELPRPHVLAPVGDSSRVDLLYDGVPVCAPRDGDVIRTYASGPMRLRAWSGGELREFEVELGDVASEDPIVVDLTKSGRVVASIVRVQFTPPPGIAAEAVTPWVAYGADVTPDGNEDSEVVATAPCRIVLVLEGYQTFERSFAGAEDTEFCWGAAALKLAVRDGRGTAAPSIVAVDGVRHWTSGGDLELKGLSAGPHDIVVSPAADALEGRALRLVLVDGETRQKTVVVGSRE